MPGFDSMQVLKPQKDGEPYLVISQWDSEEAFRASGGSLGNQLPPTRGRVGVQERKSFP